MILTKLTQVDALFFSQFAGVDLKTPVLVTDHRGDTHSFDFHLMKKSKDDLTEEDLESYPRISIVPQSPTMSDDWHNDPENVRKTYGALRNSNPAPGEENVSDFSSEMLDPMKLQFIYEVSSACRDYLGHSAIMQWFYENFKKRGAFEIDPVDIAGERHHAGLVSYSMENNDVPRSDGVYEFNCTFTVKAFLQMDDLQEFETVTTFNPVLNIKG